MIIKQLSVLLENKTGRINQATSVLSQNGINMSAFSVAENADFGILRIIVSDTLRAKELLKEAGFTVSTTDVICLRCPNKAGSLSVVLELLAAEEVFIEYMYAFSEGDVASVVIRPTDINRCVEILERNREKLVEYNF